MITRIVLITIYLLYAVGAWAQPVPAAEENIPFLVTFGEQAETSWGDDDFSQVFFFVVPERVTDPIYIRVFDPECGGEHDEINEEFNTMTRFSVYGGEGCLSAEASKSTDPVPFHDSGVQLASKTFGSKGEYDNNWYTFGPFNPIEGEFQPQHEGYIFKVICHGIRGDDGNLYRYFMSLNPDDNQPVEGGNAFTFEYTFRLHPEPWQVSHVYPYIDEAVVSIKQSNFDWDSDGYIKVFSVATPGTMLEMSKDDQWIESEYKIQDAERGNSLDIQFVNDDDLTDNNNVVFYIRNQYGELMPFYTVPIGGVPEYKGFISVKGFKK